MKDRGLMRLLTAVLLSAFCCLYAWAPWMCVAEEAEISVYDFDDGLVVLPYVLSPVVTLSDCGGSCPGHLITDRARIVALSGSHSLTLKDAELDLSKEEGVSAIEVYPDAAVRLVLEGASVLQTNGVPAIRLVAGASLALCESGEGSLTVITNSDSCIAGTESGFGDMLLESGTVSAEARSMYSTIALGNGSLRVTGGSLIVDGAPQEMTTDGVVEITGCEDGCSGHLISGGAPVLVKQGQHSITLSNARIESNTCAFMMEEGTSVRLTLIGENSLQSGRWRAGLQVQSGAALVIADDSTGSLSATGGDGAAGIGHGRDSDCGAITIEGGRVTANAGQDGTGIGVQEARHSGPITITGGEVAAYGCGKGMGMCANRRDEGSDIAISGGTVTVMGGSDTQSGSMDGTAIYARDITISGGGVTATGRNGIYSSDGSVSISGGNVCVSGEVGGIFVSGSELSISGGCVDADNKNDTTALLARFGGSITILGGEIKATGINSSGTVRILDGTVRVRDKLVYGSSSGKGSPGILTGKLVEISGGTVFASGSLGDHDGIHSLSQGQIIISGGEVTAYGGEDRPGIASASQGIIVISGGQVTADSQSGASAIGRKSDQVIITGGEVQAEGGYGYPGVGGTLVHAGGILTDNGIVFAK